MAKRLKLKLSRILPSFQTCRNEDDDPITIPTRRAPPVVSLGCGCRPSHPRRNPFAAIDADADLSRARETPVYLWRQDDLSHILSPPPTRRKIDSRRKPKPKPRPSTSSADSGWFSSDDEKYTDLFNQSSHAANNGDIEDDEDDDETETLISSSFTDSSDAINSSNEVERLKVKDSFAVVKRSEDPYADFRRSMAEMIVEKDMYEPRDLEELLHCLLSLNSRHHHRAIVSAFSEIWDALFPPSGEK
ncbi:hypothetical protein J5N97_010452 [Dioscorea zingiberensis]|uniref:Transcription repressor n=1 Tax=Dioscorea zingiberensis TaxID=325984 RepID=A0A9D5D0N1_9LILI|nr:hypothetical protein J5N97_001222 [Dioscorea zingiberensis]KAJ0982197.1 hypothetical protein J5N97_010452 [Dioscorea zingiberensis]